MITLLTRDPRTEEPEPLYVRIREIDASRTRMRAQLRHAKRMITHEDIATLIALRKVRQS